MNELNVLLITAISIAFFHTLFGPDHYIPFIVMARAKKWPYFKTVIITILCGLGHVLSSVVLGIVGIGFGTAVGKLQMFESIRGNWAGWALIVFGLMYSIYGIRQAILNKPHQHTHEHSDGHKHVHEHTHHQEHAHVHEKIKEFSYTPWVLFVVFVLGPCEPLIPLVMYPAAKMHMMAAIYVAAVFSLVTVVTMVGIVLVGVFGFNFTFFNKCDRYAHAFAGLAILLCGCAIQFLGL